MPRLLRDNGLTIAMLGLFLASLAGLVVAGWATENEELAEHGDAPIGLAEYATSGGFAEAVFENWESEFLQMVVYVVLTALLIQRGSAESKKPEGESVDRPPPRRVPRDAPWAVHRGGLVLRVYENSLSLALAALFVLSFALHAIGGAADHSEEQVRHGGAPVGVLEYVTTSRFWFESLQNWQSEFLAVGALVVLSVFLRQRGSPESKPVDAPDGATGAGD